MSKLKKGCILALLLVIVTTFILVYKSEKLYDRKKEFSTAEECIDNFFNNWYLNYPLKMGEAFCSDDFKESLSKRNLIRLRIKNYFLPDGVSYKAELLNKKEITDNYDILKAAYDRIYKDISKPQEVKFFEIKYRGYSTYSKESEEFNRLYVVIKEKDHEGWVIDNFGDSYEFRNYYKDGDKVNGGSEHD